MSNPEGDAPESMPTQLSRSMGSVWQNHTGGRPGAVSAELDGDVVRYEIQIAEGQSPGTTGYRNDAIAATARVTGRKVKAFITRHDAKTEVTTETFVLEPPRVRR